MKEVANYNSTDKAKHEEANEVDEFLLYQDNNDEPKVMFIGEKELVDRPASMT